MTGLPQEMPEQEVKQSGATMAKPRDQLHGNREQVQDQSQDTITQGSSITQLL